MTARASRPIPRLSAATLARARADLPCYDRSAPAGIVHLGVGAFARAHLGSYADDLLRSGFPAMIRGVSLRTHHAQDQLLPQDGLYCVAIREPGQEPALRVVGAFRGVATGIQAALEAIADPTVQLVTLTVTEKGYEIGPQDLDQPERSGAPAVVLARALHRRRQAGAPPVTIASLDNLLDNGGVLRRQVTVAAERIEPALAAWVGAEVPFPQSVVDRMVPATTPADRLDIEQRLGLVDEAAVSTERYCSWIIDDERGLPPLDQVGVQVVPDVEPFQRRKLWLLNAPHSALAYCGLLAGCRTIDEAVGHPVIGPSVARLVEDILQVADLPAATEPAAFAHEALHRFRNPSLGHTCVQVGADGSRKLPQRVLPVVAACHERGRNTGRFAIVVAAWIAAVVGLPVPGGSPPQVDDPAAGELRSAARSRDVLAIAEAALHGWEQPAFVPQVADALRDILQRGCRALGELG